MGKAQETVILDGQAYEFLKRRFPEKLKCRAPQCKRRHIKKGSLVHRRRTTGGITVYYHEKCWQVLRG